ncbi:hypothetical protein [Alienimonas californiensis]|uniref:Uncharacterized protein n=1 Tax=Alienimonas californiensis TaxID=2527989 RepID=A0A517PCJ4_9PLAN|nr:hypothetical protein [Alienimonas californiensis]QDT17082.1 hypothetical protein CA12_31940 [Alienimonas californiensis]
MPEGAFDQTGSGLYTPDSEAEQNSADVSDEQLLAHYRQQFEQTAADYPAGTVLTAFGLGVGFGAALGFALGRIVREQPKSLPNRAELLGEKMLASLRDVVPDSVARYLD